ncbi:MAG TPA: hypothetical protein VF962_07145 [Gemmatimonadaceae bacterium]
MEATHCFNPPTNCRDLTMTLPIIEYDHGGGRCSITGGYRYRGARSVKLVGTYLYADWCSGTIWGLNGPIASPRVIAQTSLGITTFGEDVNGELFLAENKHGGLFAISEPDPGAGRRRAVRH